MSVSRASLLAGMAFAVAFAAGQARAQTRPSPPLPDQEAIRAALMTPEPGTISTGDNAAAAPQPATIGKGLTITSGEGEGPIGSTLQTKPAKFSHRNDVIDRVPTMALPILLDAQQRQQIVQAIQSDSGKAADAGNLKPADALPFKLVADMHPLPAAIRGLPQMKNLAYVKSKDRVYLVTAETMIVVDQLSGK